VEMMVAEQLNNIDMALDIYATNFAEGRLSLTDTSKIAERSIRAHMQKAYPEDYEKKTQELFQRFIKGLVKSDKPTYTVQVD